MMTSRERLLCALSNGRPDRLPCTVHGWQPFYLKEYLQNCDWFEAFERFGMDFAIYLSPEYHYDDTARSNWRVDRRELGRDGDGNCCWEEWITTPGGILHHAGAANAITGWETEYLLKSVRDFELWQRFSPVPERVSFERLSVAKKRLGERGILRSHPFSPGQGSPWQSFCTLFGTENAILLGMDEPEILTAMLDAILEKTLRVTAMWAGTPADLVECGGGAGSSTVISPDFYRRFGLKYDQKQNAAFHAVGLKVVNHFCGGLMPMLPLVVESGADGLETMTPRSMGGDCELAEASRQVGASLFFIGGFDQQQGFERGTPATVRRMVHECFEATRDHAGYILAPSDHFFHGNPANLKAFAEAAHECIY